MADSSLTQRAPVPDAAATQGDYVRIDGPHVWIEFVCQNGFVYQGKVHYHTVYRDRTRDYGSEFSFS
ncbi:DUF3500 domain-containing protein [Streptomyces griseorubiginosus]|uniref:DUF3500 domain-containing protein n=1 Tax=Streptomyces griseorubiginosus TaxID=67304 RepID=UPI00365B660C